MALFAGSTVFKTAEWAIFSQQGEVAFIIFSIVNLLKERFGYKRL